MGEEGREGDEAMEGRSNAGGGRDLPLVALKTEEGSQAKGCGRRGEAEEDKETESPLESQKEPALQTS